MLKGDLQGANARRFNMFADQLELAATLIEGDSSTNPNRVARFGLQFGPSIGTAEHGTTNLRARIFERKVPMTRAGGSKLTDLALDPDPVKVAF